MAIYLGNQEIAINNIAPIKSVVIRPDAELIQTYSLNHKMVTDDELTFPSYSTTATTLLESEVLSPVITPNYTLYNYFIEIQMITIPEYSIETLANGRQEYSFTLAWYEVGVYPSNSLITLDKTVSANSDNIYQLTGTNINRIVSYSSASAARTTSAITYGLNQVLVAPEAASSSITLNSPSIRIRGNTSYLASTFYNALTDCRRQYIIRVYRAPKNILEYEGWNVQQSINALINNIANNNGILT